MGHITLINKESLEGVKFAYEQQLANYVGNEQDIMIEVLTAKNPEASVYRYKPVAQGYGVYKTERNRIIVVGADEAGAMYGMLDVSQQVAQGKCFESFTESSIEPYIDKRGIKFNIPLDARTPSYSDNSDSAQKNIENMWDMEFWKEFIDEMARNKYNVLSLWNLSPFPSMVKVPEYPLVALDDVKRTTHPFRAELDGNEYINDKVLNSLVTLKKMSIDEKIEFWRSVMRYAKSRYVDIYICTWNIFVYGTENAPYDIDCSIENEVTKDYFRKSVKALVETYPLLAGIGVTAGENMSRTETDVNWLMDAYGRGIMDALKDNANREFTLIHRAHFTGVESIEQAFREFPYNLEMSFKYSQAHMYATTKPAFGKEFFPQLKNGRKTWLTVRNDDYYMFRWGDIDFAREYINNMPSRDKLVGFYMGPDGYTWGREYISKKPKNPRELVIRKMWFMFSIWGQLSYNNQLSKDYFMDILNARYGKEIGDTLYKAWSKASKLLPIFQCENWRDLDFQWYPEACCSYLGRPDVVVFRDINSFIDCKSAPDSGYINVKDFCEAISNGERLDGITPKEAATELMNLAKDAIEIVIKIRELRTEDSELNDTLEDIMAMSYLGMYFSTKIEAAIHLQLARIQDNLSEREIAVDLLTQAYDIWSKYADMVSNRYLPQKLTRFKEVIDVKYFTESAYLDILLAQEK